MEKKMEHETETRVMWGFKGLGLECKVFNSTLGLYLGTVLQIHSLYEGKPTIPPPT